VREIRLIVGENIKKHRERRVITQEALAERCGLTPQFIAAIEVGIKTPSLSTVEKIITVLQIQPYQLFLTESDDDLPAKGIPEFSEKVIVMIRELTQKHEK
jgi:transcriptional regulator with XRE-family HTH domain